jgi:hypothetical protein
MIVAYAECTFFYVCMARGVQKLNMQQQLWLSSLSPHLHGSTAAHDVYPARLKSAAQLASGTAWLLR